MRGYAVDAVDSVEKMIHITRDSACSANVGHLVVTQVGDVHQLPYADNSFPLILAIGVLPWLPALQDPLKELARVLRPGGYLVVTADNVLGVFRLLDPIARLSQMVGIILRHARLRSKGAVARMHAPWTVDSALMKAGLLKQRSSTVGFGPFTVAKHKLLGDALGLRLYKVLQRCADRDVPVIRVLGSHYVVVACKPAATS
jgi:SAM-dependent methyltransferase